MIDQRLLNYLRAVGVRESEPMADNRRLTEASGFGHMQLSPEQGQLIALLLRIAEARAGIEIGVFAGYSALWMAEAIGPRGHLLACDHDAEITVRARAAWAAAGLADRIELRLGPALGTLDAEIAAGMAGRYDFALIDADKAGYIDYYERCMALVAPGGLIFADNTLWYARVADEADHSVDTEAIRAFNGHLHADDRIDLCLVPAGDGLTVVRKR